MFRLTGKGSLKQGLEDTTKYVIDYTCVDASDNIIPSEWVTAAEGLNVLWNHQSVGNDVLRGLEDLNALSKYNINLYSGDDWQIPGGSDYDNGNGLFGDFLEGSNTFPYTKITGFDNIMRGQGGFDEYGVHVDVAFMKFCFADIGDTTDTGAVFNTYKNTMEALETSYPAVTFVWFTGAITRTGSQHYQNRQIYNDLVRDYITTRNLTSNKAFLFDLADLESHDPSGNHILSGVNEILYSGYTADDAHLDDAGYVGRQMAARAMWWLLARTAGWTGPA